MVSSQNNDLLRKSNFHGEEEADDFTALFATVDVVTQKQVPHLLHNKLVTLLMFVLISHLFEHMQQISILTMDITEYLYWCFKLHQSFLLFEHLLGLLDQELDYFGG